MLSSPVMDETTHLLADSDDSPKHASMNTDLVRGLDSESETWTVTPPPSQATRLPKAQIFILLLLQLVEPVAHSVILPFINKLVYETGVTGGDFGKVGYYAGIIESLFFVAEAVMVFHWGRLSDRIGRKPVLLFGALGVTLSMTCFGLSTSYWALVVSRAISGALNGNIGVTKAAMAELCEGGDLETVIAYVPALWELGNTLGPLIGGGLAHPSERFPSIFGRNNVWSKYPYLLPCATAATFSMVAALMTGFFFRETRRRRCETPSDCTRSLHDNSRDETVSNNTPILRLILMPVINYFLLAFIELSYMVLLVLFLATPIDIGGLGLEPSTIGLAMALLGVINGVFQALFFVKIIRRFGPNNVLTFGMACFIPMFAAFPVMNLTARQSQDVTVIVWVILACQMLLLLAVSMTWSCIFLLITAASPPEQFGSANGIAQTTASIARAIAPAATTSLFALSVERDVMSGWMIYVVLLVISCVGLFTSWTMDVDTTDTID